MNFATSFPLPRLWTARPPIASAHLDPPRAPKMSLQDLSLEDRERDDPGTGARKKTRVNLDPRSKEVSVVYPSLGRFLSPVTPIRSRSDWLEKFATGTSILTHSDLLFVFRVAAPPLMFPPGSVGVVLRAPRLAVPVGGGQAHAGGGDRPHFRPGEQLVHQLAGPALEAARVPSQGTRGPGCL